MDDTTKNIALAAAAAVVAYLVYQHFQAQSVAVAQPPPASGPSPIQGLVSGLFGKLVDYVKKPPEDKPDPDPEPATSGGFFTPFFDAGWTGLTLEGRPVTGRSDPHLSALR